MILSANNKFGEAIEALRKGYRVAREGWSGKGLYIYKQIPSNIESERIPNMNTIPQHVKEYMVKSNTSLKYTNQMNIVHKEGRVDSWVPSSSDIFSEDWIIYK